MKRLELKNKELQVSKIKSYFEHNDDAKFIHRLHGILLFASKSDESCDSIGLLFGNSPRTISNWIKTVNKTGNIESLRGKPRPGRSPRLSSEQKSEIQLVLQDPPEQHGMASNLWDGKTLSAYIMEHYGITLKTRRCQTLFHELGFSLKRARPVVAKGDDNKKAESKKTRRKS